MEKFVSSDNIVGVSRLQQARAEREVRSFTQDGFSGYSPMIEQLDELVGIKRKTRPQELEIEDLEARIRKAFGDGGRNSVVTAWAVAKARAESNIVQFPSRS